MLHATAKKSVAIARTRIDIVVPFPVITLYLLPNWPKEVTRLEHANNIRYLLKQNTCRRMKPLTYGNHCPPWPLAPPIPVTVEAICDTEVTAP